MKRKKGRNSIEDLSASSSTREVACLSMQQQIRRSRCGEVAVIPKSTSSDSLI
jgi:hypothetical protein